MTETANDLKAFCDEWLDAWTGNRPEQLLSFYTEDAFYLDPANPNGLSGQSEMSAYFKKLLSRNPEWRWEAVEIFDTRNGFTLKWKSMIPVKGTELMIYGLDIVEMKDGLILRNEVYFDRLKWMELMK